MGKAKLHIRALFPGGSSDERKTRLSDKRFQRVRCYQKHYMGEKRMDTSHREYMEDPQQAGNREMFGLDALSFC